MTDLVERLRDTALWAYADGTASYGKLLDQAAAEIERLRADAARWQAIRRHGAIIPSFHAFCLMQGDALDAAIYSISEELLLDAAMKDTP